MRGQERLRRGLPLRRVRGATDRRRRVPRAAAPLAHEALRAREKDGVHAQREGVPGVWAVRRVVPGEGHHAAPRVTDRSERALATAALSTSVVTGFSSTLFGTAARKSRAACVTAPPDTKIIFAASAGASATSFAWM